MSVQLVSVVVLALLFLLGTVTKAHMGVLGFAAAFVVGTAVAGKSTDSILAGFPGDLFVIIVGVTLLFAIANSNGTIDWLIQLAIRAVGGRAAAIPWVMFAITALITGLGSVVPASIAIVAPIGLGFARKYRISPLMMSILIVNGSNAGGFSPISVYGGIIKGVLKGHHLPVSPSELFGVVFAFNVVLSIIVYLSLGGRTLLSHHQAPETPAAQSQLDAGLDMSSSEPANSRESSRALPGDGAHAQGTIAAAEATGAPNGDTGLGQTLSLDKNRALTLLGIVALLVAAAGFGLDVGLVSLTVAATLTLLAPSATTNAMNGISWNTVLLICGIVTYVSLLQAIGTVSWLGDKVAAIGAPLLAALVVCYIGGVVSAFASTTGILGALIPLAVPFLASGEIPAAGLIIALAFSSSVVDSSPFSTSGALCVANTAEEHREDGFRHLLTWGFSMIAIGPPLAWLILVALPSWV